MPSTAIRGSFMRRRSPAHSLLWLPVLMGMIGIPSPARAQDVTGAQVSRAVQKGIDYLRSTQRFDGGWPDYGLEGGATALACLAMLNAGISRDDLALRRGLDVTAAIHLDY